MEKIVRIGTMLSGKRYASVYAHISWEDERLSICGTIGPLPSGGALGSSGQIDQPKIENFAQGWNQALLDKFFQIWKRWHLNDLRAECEHQRALGWTWADHPMAKCPICGYKLGSGWHTEPVPHEIIAILSKLPDADRQPAWV